MNITVNRIQNGNEKKLLTSVGKLLQHLKILSKKQSFVMVFRNESFLLKKYCQKLPFSFRIYCDAECRCEHNSQSQGEVSEKKYKQPVSSD